MALVRRSINRAEASIISVKIDSRSLRIGLINFG